MGYLVPNSALATAGIEFGGAREAGSQVADPALHIRPKSTGALLLAYCHSC